MDTTASSFTARGNAKRAAERMIANGTAPAIYYDINPREDGRFEIVWKDAPTTGEVEAENAAPAPAPDHENGHYSSNPLLSIKSDSNYVAPKAQTDETAAATAYGSAASNAPASRETATDNKWPDGTRVMVRKRKSWREATIISRLDPDLWRAEYPGGGSGMFREADIRAYDPERDANIAEQPRRAKATTPQNSSRSRYAIDPETITAGRLPQRAPVVTSAANPHYQKHFDRLFDLAKAGDWDGVRNYEVKGSNSYSKMVARYRQDLLAVHAASEGAP